MWICAGLVCRRRTRRPDHHPGLRGPTLGLEVTRGLARGADGTDREARLSSGIMPSAHPEGRRSMLRALRHRNYRLFFAGQSLSLVGTWITRIATSWLIYRLTGSALLLGIVGFCGQIPTLFLAPVAGVFVDRWNRHRVLVITQVLSMLQSLALAVLALAGHHHRRGGAGASGPAGCHQRLRHPGAPGVRRVHDRGPGRPPQRHRAQLLHGECQPDPRAVHRRRADRGGGRGLVLPGGRDLLSGGDRVAPRHAHGPRGAPGAARSGWSRSSPPASATSPASRRSGPCCSCSRW